MSIGPFTGQHPVERELQRSSSVCLYPEDTPKAIAPRRMKVTFGLYLSPGLNLPTIGLFPG
jgi:hypothetical protein